ncbi:alpha/beta hydrolase family protein [Alteromonas flava]|uniref:alpha/beta hydrolase family protein n=1 Tax=Alteromonas flava TaxID=2048003 RepID=UPI000C28187C|nr:hypothetical protein [Alteromonas flava]
MSELKARELQPLSAGPHPVASTNLIVSENYQALDSEEMETYLSGKRTWYGSQRYLTDILKHPDAAWTVDVTIPDREDMYATESEDTVPVTAFITYPTVSGLTNNSYQFPYQNSAYGAFIYMLGPGEQPLFADSDARYPLVVLAHGATAHGIYDIQHANSIASHGYIVAVIFYGDNRFSRLFGDNDHIGFLRPLFTKAVIDSIVDSREFGQHVDANNIAVSCHSYGGFTALALAGADISGNASSVKDSRVKAIVAAAPWTGGNFEGEDVFAFGKNNSSLQNVSVPTLAFFGTDDTVTTKESILPAMQQLSGPRYVIELVDQPHIFEGGSWEDRDNWELLFLNAYLRSDTSAFNMLATGTEMQGGNIDRQLFEYQRR